MPDIAICFSFEAEPDPHQPGRTGYRIVADCPIKVQRQIDRVIRAGGFAHVSFVGPIRFMPEEGAPMYGALGYSLTKEAVQ